MSAMLGALVDQVADEIRLGLPPDLLAHAEPDRDRIVAAAVAKRRARSPGADPAAAAPRRRAIDQRRLPRGARARATAARSSGWSATATARSPARRWRWRWRAAAAATASAGSGSNSTTFPHDEAQCLVHLVAAAMRRGIAATSVAIDEALAERRRAPARPPRRTAPRRSARAHSGRSAGRRARRRRRPDRRARRRGRCRLARRACARCAPGSRPRRRGCCSSTMARATRCCSRGSPGSRGPPRRRWSRRWPNPCCGASRARRSPASTAPAAADIDAARRWWRLPPAYRDGLEQQGGGDGQPLD